MAEDEAPEAPDVEAVSDETAGKMAEQAKIIDGSTELARNLVPLLAGLKKVEVEGRVYQVRPVSWQGGKMPDQSRLVRTLGNPLTRTYMVFDSPDGDGKPYMWKHASVAHRRQLLADSKAIVDQLG